MSLTRPSVELDAANGALSYLGEGRISSLNEDRIVTTYLRDHFANVRDGLLRRHNWNFATHWEVLSEDPTLIKGLFSKTFPLPSDCLKVRSVADTHEDSWAVEARVKKINGSNASFMVLSTDIPSPRIQYTRRVEEISTWDNLFLEIFEICLAAKIAPLMNRGNAQELLNLAESKMPTAKRIDEREKSRSIMQKYSPYIAARFV